MEGTKAKGEYRCLTPQEISSTVVMFRKMMDWKQLTLALEAGVNERTVQRIERGESGCPRRDLQILPSGRPITGRPIKRH